MSTWRWSYKGDSGAAHAVAAFVFFEFLSASRMCAGANFTTEGIATVALFLMHEAFYNPTSYWAPYIRLLPRSFPGATTVVTHAAAAELQGADAVCPAVCARASIGQATPTTSAPLRCKWCTRCQHWLRLHDKVGHWHRRWRC